MSGIYNAPLFNSTIFNPSLFSSGSSANTPTNLYGNNAYISGTTETGINRVLTDSFLNEEPYVTNYTANLQNNQLTTKYYVDNTIANSLNDFPQVFTFGRNYTSPQGSVSPYMNGGYIFIKKLDFADKYISSVCVEIVYKLIESTRNTTSITKQTVIYGLYQLSYNRVFGSQSTFLGSNGTAILLAGQSLTGNLNNYGTCVPIVFSGVGNNIKISYNFPYMSGLFPTTGNSMNSTYWISDASVTMRLVSSSPHTNTTNGIVLGCSKMNDDINSITGGCYFSLS
jgi:hypothetical protein